MRDCLKALDGCKDVTRLRAAIHELCAGIGELSHFEVLTLSRSGKHQALCFFRLESAAQELRLMASLGASRFGNDLLLVVDLPAGQANIAEQPEDSDRDRMDRDVIVRRPGRGQDENAGDTQLWFNPARWSGPLLGAARRVLDREAR
jgi:hypothetical protein